MPKLLALANNVRTVQNAEFPAESAAIASSGMARPATRPTLLADAYPSLNMRPDVG